MLPGSHVVRLLRIIRSSRLVCPGMCLQTKTGPADRHLKSIRKGCSRQARENQPERLRGQAEAVIQGRLADTRNVHGFLQSSRMLLWVSCRGKGKRTESITNKQQKLIWLLVNKQLTSGRVVTLLTIRCSLEFSPDRSVNFSARLFFVVIMPIWRHSKWQQGWKDTDFKF